MDVYCGELFHNTMKISPLMGSNPWVEYMQIYYHCRKILPLQGIGIEKIEFKWRDIHLDFFQCTISKEGLIKALAQKVEISQNFR